LLQLIHGTSSATSSSPEKCPGWLDDYAAMHKQHKNDPSSSTRYLIWYCPASEHHCRGFGDRIRGMLLAFRIAAAFNRVLLFKWEEPIDLEVVMHPNRINWSMLDMDNADQLLATQNDYTTDIWLMHNTKFADAVRDGKGLREFNATKVVIAKFLDWPSMRLWKQDPRELPPTTGKGSQMEPGMVAYLGCLAKFLFTPSEELQRRTDEALQALYGRPKPPSYVAWHWRTGGQEGETYQVAKDSRLKATSRLHMLLSALVCLDSMKEQYGVTVDTAAVLATDLNPVRSMVIEGKLAPGLVALDIKAAHPEKVLTEKSKAEMTEISMAAWTDIMVLAQAECLLASESGFSLVALLMSANHCFQQMYDCTRDAAKALGGVPLHRMSHHRRLGQHTSLP